jgi:hypothetical protein
MATAAMVGLLAGCSDSKSSSKESSPAAQSAEANLHDAAMKAYWATMRGDYETDWNLISARCRAKLVNNDFKSFASQLQQAYADRAPQLVKMGDPKITVTVDGTTGKVKTDAPDGKSQKEAVTWALIDGQWVNDNC